MQVTEHFILDGEYLGERQGIIDPKYFYFNKFLYCPKCGERWGTVEIKPGSEKLPDMRWIGQSHTCKNCNDEDGGMFFLYFHGGFIPGESYIHYPYQLLLRELFLAARKIDEGVWR